MFDVGRFDTRRMREQRSHLLSDRKATAIQVTNQQPKLSSLIAFKSDLKPLARLNKELQTSIRRKALAD